LFIFNLATMQASNLIIRLKLIFYTLIILFLNYVIITNGIDQQKLEKKRYNIYILFRLQIQFIVDLEETVDRVVVHTK